MKKILAMSALVLTFSSALTGCGADREEDSDLGYYDRHDYGFSDRDDSAERSHADRDVSRAADRVKDAIDGAGDAANDVIDGVEEAGEDLVDGVAGSKNTTAKVSTKRSER